MCNFEHKKNTPQDKKKGVRKDEKLQRQKKEAAERFHTPPPNFCLGVKK